MVEYNKIEVALMKHRQPNYNKKSYHFWGVCVYVCKTVKTTLELLMPIKSASMRSNAKSVLYVVRM